MYIYIFVYVCVCVKCTKYNKSSAHLPAFFSQYSDITSFAVTATIPQATTGLNWAFKSGTGYYGDYVFFGASLFSSPYPQC